MLNESSSISNHQLASAESVAKQFDSSSNRAHTVALLASFGPAPPNVCHSKPRRGISNFFFSDAVEL